MIAFEAASSRLSKRCNSKYLLPYTKLPMYFFMSSFDHVLNRGPSQYHAASFKLKLFFICCNSITEQKQLIMVNKMWSRVENIFKQTKKKTIGAVICVLHRTNSQCKLTRMRSRFDLRTHPIYLGNIKRRLLNSSYFSFAAIRSRSKTTHHCQ